MSINIKCFPVAGKHLPAAALSNLSMGQKNPTFFKCIYQHECMNHGSSSSNNTIMERKRTKKLWPKKDASNAKVLQQLISTFYRGPSMLVSYWHGYKFALWFWVFRYSLLKLNVLLSCTFYISNDPNYIATPLLWWRHKPSNWIDVRRFFAATG